MNARLENPSLGSAQSGIAAISGWACEAQTITIELNGVPYRAGYPTTRPDTQDRCGDTDNGFSLLWNWNNLGPGTHTVRALLDGQEFANTTVRVTTFGEQVLRGREWHVSPVGLSSCRRHDPDTLGRVVAELCDYSLTWYTVPQKVHCLIRLLYIPHWPLRPSASFAQIMGCDTSAVIANSRE